MFFAPDDYLQRDPAEAGSEREAARLQRDAERRAKLCEATTRLAAKGGLEAAAIHLAASYAGMGQGTYYKLYDSREACLREAFERCAEVVQARVEVAAARDGGDFASRLGAGLSELLALLDAHPDVAHLLLVAILAGDDRCREARERCLGRFARLLACEQAVKRAPQRGSTAWMTAAALASALALGLDDDEPLADLLGELVRVASWPQGVESSMRVEGTTGDDGPEAVEAAPRRREAERARSRRSQRERILAAITEMAGTKGYKAAHVADVLKQAEVSAPVFYGHFDGKAECFLAAYDRAIGSILERVERSVERVDTCAEKTEIGLRAVVESLAEQPAIARLAAIEIRLVGDSGEERYEKTLMRFAQLVGELGDAGQKDGAAEVTAPIARTVAGMIAREVGEGRTAQLVALLPDLVFTALAPYLGGEKAAAQASATRLGQTR